ncbi:alpha-E domain-containing protein [Croceitalea rosinachiae]|uniref:Alpha-E domain-containing protein n=1 Tax=Croceitalea rosinachiae TaxID=3075596 RepID=A0ABU3AB30_9FLAO|nr:alpha-E domain-containing protein [Croceitalea sp. F388]MDT0607389.1 alpha-E domain-containing protein [Croceitalea sp. F388]
MLSRVADNLFWMGRYIERSEHIARYLNVNYFSSLDAPNEISQSRDFVLKSMLFMLGEPAHEHEVLNEEKVLFDIGLNPESYYSIINNVKAIRENANSARDLISNELYESINKYYHFILNYDKQLFVKKGLYDFTVNVTEQALILRGKIRASLLHDEVYAIIMMGINIERATQIIRITNAKYHDATLATGSYGDTVGNSFEWITLLKCAEAYDMMRRHYRKTPSSISTLEFVILNGDCPRSVMNSLDQICKHINVLDKTKYPTKNSTAFLVGKLRSEFQYMKVEEIETDVKGFIERILRKLFEISKQMEEEFFKY